MIVIKTSEGTHFINEHEVQHIAHYYVNKTFIVSYKDGKEKEKITEVENIWFLSYEQIIGYKDQGSDVQRLLEENEDMKSTIERYGLLDELLSNTMSNIEYIANEGNFAADILRSMLKSEIERFQDMLKQIGLPLKTLMNDKAQKKPKVNFKTTITCAK